MDKRSLYDGLNSLETDLDSSVTQLREIKAALHELVEKNTTLEIENQRLREHLQELNKLAGNTTETEKQELCYLWGTYALSLVDTANKKERFGLTVNRLSNQTFIYL